MKVFAICIILFQLCVIAWFVEREQRHTESFRLMTQSALGFYGYARACEEKAVRQAAKEKGGAL